MAWSSSTVAAALHTDKRWATQAFAQGVAKASISLSFMTFTMWLIVGVPNIMGSLPQNLINLGLPGLFGLHCSPGLHPLEP